MANVKQESPYLKEKLGQMYWHIKLHDPSRGGNRVLIAFYDNRKQREYLCDKLEERLEKDNIEVKNLYLKESDLFIARRLRELDTKSDHKKVCVFVNDIEKTYENSKQYQEFLEKGKTYFRKRPDSLGLLNQQSDIFLDPDKIKNTVVLWVRDKDAGFFTANAPDFKVRCLGFLFLKEDVQNE